MNSSESDKIVVPSVGEPRLFPSTRVYSIPSYANCSFGYTSKPDLQTECKLPIWEKAKNFKRECCVNFLWKCRKLLRGFT
ncbi:unnamed protein product [Larinioides sclopetarius]|uniref:Uncharacterized protein n=1 Tax=Larinioides sclopetarius TaxID=280406 RepID=A0AAV2AXM8_9ARAC